MTKLLYVLCGLYMLAAPLLVGILLKDVVLAGIVAACGAFVCLLLRLPDLLELSLGPVKAKMRETVREATATIAQLQTMATVQAKAQLNQLMHSNFGWDGSSNAAERLALHDQIIVSLADLGVSSERIVEAETTWRAGVGVIYHRWVHHYLTQAKEHKYSIDTDAARRAADEIQSKLDFTTWTAPGPDVIEDILNKHGVATDPLREWLEDYRSFLRTRQLSRREVFVTR